MHPFTHIRWGGVGLFTALEDERFCRTFVYTDSAADAQVLIHHHGLVELVGGLVGGLELQGVHGTTLDA